MTPRIAFVGAPGVGKSTLTEMAMAALREQGLRVGYAAEFAREFIDQFDFPEHSGMQYMIMRQQRAREEAAARNNDVMVTDTALFFSYLYPSIFRAKDSTPQEAFLLQDILAEALDHVTKYDVTFYLPLRDEIVDDGIRVPRDTPMIDTRMRSFIELHHWHFPDVVHLPKGDAVDQLPAVLDRVGSLLPSAGTALA